MSAKNTGLEVSKKPAVFSWNTIDMSVCVTLNRTFFDPEHKKTQQPCRQFIHLVLFSSGGFVILLFHSFILIPRISSCLFFF
ncbi:hypothetical protein VTP01DRAFT_9810 [Rhizomucor pusillus]|uniref:uncharacterized protein n=1 Tax=Rhizomucor pusillus TaxID=4840 RepID=UPI003742ABD6